MVDVRKAVPTMRDETRWWTPGGLDVVKGDRDRALVRPMSGEGTTVTGDEQSMDLGKLRHGLFNRLETRFRIDEDEGTLAVTGREQVWNTPVHELETIGLEIRDDGGKPLDTVPVRLVEAASGGRPAVSECTMPVDTVRRGLVVLVLAYCGGITVERPVPGL